jgi:type I restriction enzyme S subunit
MGEAIMTDKPSFTNQQINTIVPNGKVEPSFLYYSLRPRKQELLSLGATTGVRTPILNKSAFCDLKVKIPPFPLQRRIAGILSAYDDLIENNQRRIKILEEMARSLYREWFVTFRFPGHEKIPLVDSSVGPIPKGWAVKKLGSLADISWGDTSTTKASYVEDGYHAFSATGKDGKLDHYDFDKEGIVLSAIGANCGRTWFARGKWSCIKNTIRFWATNEFTTTEFLFFATLEPSFWPKRGAAQPFISQGDAERILILCPDRHLMTSFSKFAASLLYQIDCLDIQNANLRRTRDLLLPRLLCGDLEGSNPCI